LSGNWLDSDGFATRRFDTTDRGYRNLSATLAATTKVDDVDLALRGWHSEGTSEYSDFFATPVDQDYRNTSLAAEGGWQPVSGWTTRLRIANFQSRIEQNQSDDFVETRRWQMDWQNDVTAGEHHRLTFGALAGWEKADTLSFGSGFDASTNTKLLYAQDQIEAGRHRVLLATGYTDHSTFGGHTTWNAEYGLALRPGLSVFAATGTAFRAPDSTDRFGFGGNPDLDPERSRQYEVGLRGRIGERQSWSASVFRNQVNDLIQFVTVSFDPFVGENRNVELARITGVDLDWQYRGELWQLRAGLNLQQPRDLADDSRLLRRARRNATFALARRFGSGRVGLDLLAAGNRRDFGFPEPVRLGGYMLANLSAQWTFGDRLTLTARVENLLDRDYELASGYNTVGRSLFASLRYSLR
jgi:vitamin B12 transporter